MTDFFFIFLCFCLSCPCWASRYFARRDLICAPLPAAAVNNSRTLCVHVGASLPGIGVSAAVRLTLDGEVRGCESLFKVADG